MGGVQFAVMRFKPYFSALALASASLACRYNATSAGAAAPDTAPRIAAIHDEFARKRFYETCAEPRPPGSACGLLADTFWSKARLVSYVETSCPSGGAHKRVLVGLARGLVHRVVRTLRARLIARRAED